MGTQNFNDAPYRAHTEIKATPWLEWSSEKIDEWDCDSSYLMTGVCTIILWQTKIEQADQVDLKNVRSGINFLIHLMPWVNNYQLNIPLIFS